MKRIKLEASCNYSENFIDDLKRLTKTHSLDEIKSFIIFGNSLYPHNFAMKFAAYQYMKKSQDYKMSASLLNEMYTNFPSELYDELVQILEDVKTDQKSANKEIFFCLDAQIQYDILSKFCQSLCTTYDQIILLLEVVKAMSNNIRNNLNTTNSNNSSFSGSRCFQLIASEIDHLFNLIADAEEDWRHNWNEYIKNDESQFDLETNKMKNVDLTLNFYRYLLSTEVLPIVHSTTKGVIDFIDKRVLTDLVMNSIQFYLAYVGFIPDHPEVMEMDSDNIVVLRIHGIKLGTSINSLDDSLNGENVWFKLKKVLSMAGDMLKWYGCFASASIGNLLSSRNANQNLTGHHSYHHQIYHYNQHQLPNGGLPLPIVYELLSTTTYCRQVQALLDYASSSSLNRQMFLLQQIGCVVWVGLAQLIMEYLKLSKPYLWYGGSKLEEKYANSVFMFCRGESDCKLVNYKKNCKKMRQIHEAFSIAIKLYAAVPIKEWDKISEKVEPMIRSQNWAFDSMFFLDLSLLRRPLAKGKSYLRDSRLKSLYPKIIRDLISATISQCNRDKNKKTLKILLEILHTLTHGDNPDEPKSIKNLKNCFEELPEMIVGYTYLIEFNAENLLMIILHLLHGWLSSVATSRFKTAPEAASYLLVLDQIKLIAFSNPSSESNTETMNSALNNLKSEIQTNIFILVNEGLEDTAPLEFVDYLFRLEILEEIILQIDKFYRNNLSENANEDKMNFVKSLKDACLNRLKSPLNSNIENVLMEFIKNFKSNISVVIG